MSCSAIKAARHSCKNASVTGYSEPLITHRGTDAELTYPSIPAAPFSTFRKLPRMLKFASGIALLQSSTTQIEILILHARRLPRGTFESFNELTRSSRILRSVQYMTFWARKD
jgi:hypothetical protein